ncbi:hypothetical protein KCP73_11880 [Salmonella enterica subsp. enterica]|nr:hypothetical protein KCP73_11880 [Salmonella enterica subsp. enterica]
MREAGRKSIMTLLAPSCDKAGHAGCGKLSTQEAIAGANAAMIHFAKWRSQIDFRRLPA